VETRTDRWWSGKVLEMPTDECWELLDARMVGRLAWQEDAGPAIVPVNYVVGDGYVYFRTKPESSIGRNAIREQISFQVDDVDDFNQSGWSVLVRGRAEEAPHEECPEGWDAPSNWPEQDRPLLIRIVPAEVTGRRLLSS
jgi:nitroimidazol reductase NimA-like FMN-containing flavoprotein (pyridoxamine 5'-phosphate oxidase superfamily)